MTQPIDRAFVEIEPNTRDFSRKLNRDVEKSYDQVEKQTQLLSKKITKTIDAAGREIKRTFETVAKNGKVQTRIIEDAFDDAGDKIQRVFKTTSAEGVEAEELIAVVAKIAADSTADSWERAGERIEDAFREAQRVAARESAQMAIDGKLAAESVERNFAGPLDRAFKSIGESIVSIGSALVGLGAAAPTPAGLIAIVAVIGAIGALIGPVIALVGALADLVGLVGPLPAALGVLVAAVTPLIFAFQGLGDAIEAINKGDPEKIAKAMKKLSPAAREVVREITGLNRVFDRFRKNIQQSFFAPLIGDIGRTVRVLLPNLQRSIDLVATSLGRAASNLLEFLRQPATIKILNQLFQTTAHVVDVLGVGLGDVTQAFFNLIQAGLPFIKRFADAFGGLLTQFAKFINRSIESGKFTEFVEDAIATTKELLGLVGALGNLFGALFGSADDEGRDFIKTLTDIINNLADFFRSAEGQKGLQNFVDQIKDVVAIIKFLIGAIKLGISYFNFLNAVLDGVISGFQTGVHAIGEFLQMLGEAVVHGIGAVIDFFKALPGQLLDALKALPGLVVGIITRMFDDVMHLIGVGIGLVLFTFTELPKRIIGAVQALPELLGDIISAAWQFAEQKTLEGITAVIGFIKSLPSRIIALAGFIGASISAFFTRIFSGGKDRAKSAFDAIVGFFKNLPSRLGAFIGDVGGRIGDAIKNVLNRAINRINEGIAAVDDKLPGSLPRIPNLAEGAIVRARPGGTIARIAEAGQDEIVGPLRDVAKLFEGAGNTTITFGPGSVLVTFEGAVPTPEQARQTGLAVGQGIVATLNRRNVRTSVRTL